ncbi:MAG TPA: hypothetical protein PKO15_09445 [Fibrobacteria bacterium]|nr:hypothetical protein [Fibrobacteria bacterium]HOX50746.1 hypothetical protein [Fibrobacteria bacterium]
MYTVKQFLSKNLAVRILPLVLSGWLVQSCNNSVVEEEPPPPPPVGKSVDSLPIYSLGGDALLPDSASWKIGKDSGNANLVVVEKRKNDTAIIAVRLDRKSFSDTLKVQYWKYGVLVQTRFYLSDGPDANDLPDLMSKLDQSSNRILLAALADLRRSADSSQYPSSRTGLVAAYANMVLAGSSKVNFPDSLPTGFSKDTIQNLVIVMAVKKGVTAADLVKTQIGLSLPQLEVRINLLIELKVLTSGDKDKLIPPSTIKWESPFELVSTSVKQDEALGLKGKVSTGSKWTTRSIEVFNKDNLNVTSQFAITQPKDSSILVFDDVVKLIASADLGTYKVQFTGKNEKGDITIQSATFDVVKSDDPQVVLKPQITRLQPSGNDSTLGFGTEAITVKWKVKDDSRYKIVATSINGMEATLESDSTCSVTIKLAPGQDSVVRLKVTSSSVKTSTDTVLVRRAKDGEKPKITKQNWAFDSALTSSGAYQFDKQDVKVTMTWSISDNYKFHADSAACILIAGKPVACLEVKTPDSKKPLEGVVSYDYDVPNLYSNVTLRVKDAAGNYETDKVDFSRPQKEGDILAVWDSFNWDAPKVVWQ